MIPFVDLQAQYRKIQTEIEEAVLSVLRSGQYILGPEVREIESRLASYVGVKHAVSCASGTDALLIALMAKGIGPGDAVLTTPFTFFATAEVIALLGATPVFVDIDPVTFNIDPIALEETILSLKGRGNGFRKLPRIPDDELAKLNVRGIIPVDLFGIPANYDEINAIATRHDLFVIEDAAQSFGGKYHERRVGGLAEIACTSFFPAKPLGCYGDGGALFTDDDELANLFRSIRAHGMGADRYENVRIGITGRLDTIQAAILMPKLKIIDFEIGERQRVAEAYAQKINKYAIEVEPPSVPAGYYSAWAQYSILAKDASHRQLLLGKLKAASVPTAIYYPKPLHLQKAFARLHYRIGDFPVSEAMSDRIFAVPMHPYLDDETIETIVTAMV